MCPCWDHGLGYGRMSRKRLKKVLFLKFEDVKHARHHLSFEKVGTLLGFLSPRRKREPEEEERRNDRGN